MSEQTTNIVILGGGYAGIMAALRIAGKTKRLDTAVTLINALDHFVERPRLHEQALGTEIEQRPMHKMLAGSKARFLQGWVTGILPETRQVAVETDAGTEQLPYDYLVLALGSRVERASKPGIEEHAYALDPYGPLATVALKERLEALGQSPFRALVAGAGATGIEAATQLKATYPNSEVTLVTAGAACAFKGPRIQEHIMGALAEQRIEVVERTKVTAVTASGVMTAGNLLAADVVIWAGGFVASPLARDAGLRVNELYQVQTDPFLRSLSHPRIYAVGDMADPIEEPGAPMRMSLFTALVSGAQAADNIVRDIKGRAPRPLSFAWYGQGIALGKRDAVGFATYPADVLAGPVLRGRPAVFVRNFFVRFLKTALELERRFPGFLFWNGRKRYARQKRTRQQQSYAAPTLR